MYVYFLGDEGLWLKLYLKEIQKATLFQKKIKNQSQGKFELCVLALALTRELFLMDDMCVSI